MNNRKMVKSTVGNSVKGIVAADAIEKHFKTREVAITQGIEALAEYKLRTYDEARDLFKDEKHSDLFRDVFTKTSVDGFVAATIALYTIPENVVGKLQTSHCKLFAITDHKRGTGNHTVLNSNKIG
jgi:hypothetical protein